MMNRRLVPLLALMCGCAGGRAPVPPQPTDQARSPSEQLQYDELDTWEQRVNFTINEMYLVRKGYEERVEPQRITGTEAQELYARSELQLPAATELLKREGAIVLYWDLPDHPDIPEGSLFVLKPSGGFERADEIPAPGFLSNVGVEHIGELNPALETELPPFADNPEPLPALSPSELRAKLDAKELFVIFLSADGCGGSRRFYPLFAQIVGAHGFTDVYDVNAEQYHKDKTTHALMLSLSPEISFPSLFRVVDGKVVDRRIGGPAAPATYWRVMRFFQDNGFVEGEVDWVLDMRQKPKNRDHVLRQLADAKELTSRNFAGVDLSGAILKNNYLSGSIFRDADLSGADLRNTTLSHADFTGANIDGADFRGAVFFNTTCPDGELADPDAGCARE